MAKKRRLSKSKQKSLKKELDKSGGRGRAVRKIAGARRTEPAERERDSTLTDRYRTIGDSEDTEMFEEQGEKIRRRVVSRKEAGLRQSVFEEAQQLASKRERPDHWRCGIVTKLVPKGCVVDDGGDAFECFLRGSLRELLMGQAKPVAVGDVVWIEPQADGTAAVEEIEPRRTKLSRPTPRMRHTETVVVANVDQLVIVASVAEPEFKQGLVDRYLVAAERGGMEAILCVNKTDLADDEHPLPELDFYDELGYRVLFTSTERGEGIDEFRSALTGRTSVLAGHSGTGKSSLINAVQPDLELQVGDVSQSTSKGRHTTVTVTLLPLVGGGYVVDTPGIRAFGLWDLHREELAEYFPEMIEPAGQCQMSDCSHTHEPSCEVKACVEDGRIAPERYDSYASIYESLPSSSPWEKQ